MQLIRVGMPKNGKFVKPFDQILQYPYGKFFVRTNSMIAPEPEVYFDDETFLSGYIELFVEDRYAQMTVDRMASGSIWGRIVEFEEA